jgi:hypothetical protein
VLRGPIGELLPAICGLPGPGAAGGATP